MNFFTSNSELVWMAVLVGIVVPIVIAFAAARVANRWQRRTLTLQILEELHGDSMQTAREYCIKFFIDAKYDPELLDSEAKSFMTSRGLEAVPPWGRNFAEAHALSRILFFLAKIQLLRRKGMIDDDVLVPATAHFFSHYRADLTKFLDRANMHMTTAERAMAPDWFYGARAFYMENDRLIATGRFDGGLAWYQGR
ncbi:MAG: hypothetical protein ACFCBV_06110 [Phycisphaerales bacterium]